MFEKYNTHKESERAAPQMGETMSALRWAFGLIAGFGVLWWDGMPFGKETQR